MLSIVDKNQANCSLIGRWGISASMILGGRDDSMVDGDAMWSLLLPPFSQTSSAPFWLPGFTGDLKVSQRTLAIWEAVTDSEGASFHCSGRQNINQWIQHLGELILANLPSSHSQSSCNTWGRRCCLHDSQLISIISLWVKYRRAGSMNCRAVVIQMVSQATLSTVSCPEDRSAQSISWLLGFEEQSSSTFFCCSNITRGGCPAQWPWLATFQQHLPQQRWLWDSEQQQDTPRLEEEQVSWLLPKICYLLLFQYAGLYLHLEYIH